MSTAELRGLGQGCGAGDHRRHVPLSLTEGISMAGRIGKVGLAQDGSSYGFIAARHVQGLLVTTRVCEKR
jgi:hypothetical protein